MYIFYASDSLQCTQKVPERIMIHAHCNKKGTDKETNNFIQTNGKENRTQPIF